MQQNGISLQGVDEIQRLMKAFGPAASKRAGTAGVRAAALLMKAALKAASPVRSGTLKREWQIKKLRARRNSKSTAYTVRLKRRHYYELLEFSGIPPGRRKKAGSGSRQWAHWRRGQYNPFAEKAIMKSKLRAFDLMMEKTEMALYLEAGKTFEKSRRAGQIR